MSIFSRMFGFLSSNKVAGHDGDDGSRYPYDGSRHTEVESAEVDTVELPVQRTLRIEQANNGIYLLWNGINGSNGAIIHTQHVAALSIRTALTNGNSYCPPSNTFSVPVTYDDRQELDDDTVRGLISKLREDGILSSHSGSIYLSNGVTLN